MAAEQNIKDMLDVLYELRAEPDIVDQVGFINGLVNTNSYTGNMFIFERRMVKLL